MTRPRAVGHSPLLQQVLAQQATRGPTDFRQQHPLAAALHGISQGLHMRALRKAEKERLGLQDAASDALRTAVAGNEVTLGLPQSQDEFSYGGDEATFGQPPGGPNQVLAAALNPNLSGQQAQIGMSVAGQRSAAQQAAAEAAIPPPPVKLGKNDRLVDARTGEEIIGPIQNPERLNLGKGVVANFLPDGSYEILRIKLPEGVTRRGHMASQAEKARKGLPTSEMYWIDGATGKPHKISGSTETKAARIAQLEIGTTAWANVRKAVFDTKGGLNRFAVNAARMNIPFLKGVTIRGEAIKAIEAYLRATSGAAVPESEVERAFAAFFPGRFQSADDAKMRMDALDQFLSGSYDLLIPETATDEERQAAVREHVDTMVAAVDLLPLDDAEAKELAAMQGQGLVDEFGGN